MKTKEFIRIITSLNAGERIYINAINLNERQIDFLRDMLRRGELTPDPDELDKMIVKSAQHKFIAGECIAPQMTYVKPYMTFSEVKMVDIEIIDHVKAVHEFCEKQQYCHECPLLTVCGADAPEYWHMNELSHAERKIINANVTM